MSEIIGDGARKTFPSPFPQSETDHISLHVCKRTYHAVLKPSGATDALGHPIPGDSLHLGRVSEHGAYSTLLQPTAPTSCLSPSRYGEQIARAP